jgi:phage terminase Nu1 subunit (DNA packaging protein)
MAATGQFYESKVIAQLFGVSVRRIQQLTQEGIIETVQVPGQGRRYELVPTIQAYTKYLADKAYGREQSDREAELKEQKMKADIALKESQGELHRLKTEIAAGKYIAVEEVRLDYERFFVTFKNFAMSLPTRLVDEISSYVEPVEARRIEKDLHQRVKNLLVAFVVAGVTKDDDNAKK